MMFSWLPHSHLRFLIIVCQQSDPLRTLWTSPYTPAKSSHLQESKTSHPAYNHAGKNGEAGGTTRAPLTGNVILNCKTSTCTTDELRFVRTEFLKLCGFRIDVQDATINPVLRIAITSTPWSSSAASSAVGYPALLHERSGLTAGTKA